jgi:C-terminal regulatory domain of Threonine dehydratase
VTSPEVTSPSALQVEFPERSGALVKFLRVLNPVWNISLFHYRQSGNRASTILLGLQVHCIGTCRLLSHYCFDTCCVVSRVTGSFSRWCRASRSF